jgi:hypothetical protein
MSKSTPPTKPTRKAKADTSKILPNVNGRLAAGREARVPIARGGEGELPSDLPMLIEVERVLGVFRNDEAGNAEGLMGHIVDIDLPVHGVRLTIKLYRDPRNVIITANEIEVYRGAGATKATPKRTAPAPLADEELLDDDELIFDE